MIEKDIENNILYYLSMKSPGTFWKVDVGGIFDAAKKTFRKRKSKYQYKGVPDIIGFYRGKFVSFEIKTPQRRNQCTEEQKQFGKTCVNNGQHWSVVTALDDVINILDVIDDIVGEHNGSIKVQQVQ